MLRHKGFPDRYSAAFALQNCSHFAVRLSRERVLHFLAWRQVMETQNVTLSLPKDLVRKAKIIAVERQTSISGLLKDLLAEIVAQEDRYAAARNRHLEVLHQGMDLGTSGMIRWMREEMHER